MSAQIWSEGLTRALLCFIALRQQILLPCTAMHLLGLHHARTKNALLQSDIFTLY